MPAAGRPAENALGVAVDPPIIPESPCIADAEYPAMTCLRSLHYISRRLVPVPDVAGAIDSIVELSVARNLALNVTGALIATESRFAQVLEGPADAITDLMASIRRDPRHTEIAVRFDEAIEMRRFAGWAMAYRGNAGFVSRLVDADATDPASDAPDRRRLVRFMRGMATR